MTTRRSMTNRVRNEANSIQCCMCMAEEKKEEDRLFPVFSQIDKCVKNQKKCKEELRTEN